MCLNIFLVCEHFANILMSDYTSASTILVFYVRQHNTIKYLFLFLWGYIFLSQPNSTSTGVGMRYSPTQPQLELE